ncbi:MAG: SprT family zinc-dependent metalloprotease [Rubrivivax sp.]
MPRPSAPADPQQLSLFGPAPLPGAAVPPAAHPAEARPADRPEPPPAPATSFVHPQAQREMRLRGHHVGYALRHARRRSIGFVVGTEGLTVSAPRWVGIREIEAALQAKGDWVLRKLHEQRERAQRLERARIDWREGAGVPYLGETVIVLLDPRVDGVALDSGGDAALPGVPRRLLRVGLPHDAAPAQIRDAVQAWLQRQARSLFEQRCAHFAPRLKVHMRRLALSSASTRWGSASADGSIRLNWRLVHFALPVIDYVVAHELAHLREMHHGPSFWEVVRTVIPDLDGARGALRDGALPLLD